MEESRLKAGSRLDSYCIIPDGSLDWITAAGLEESGCFGGIPRAAMIRLGDWLTFQPPEQEGIAKDNVMVSNLETRWLGALLQEE